MLLYISSLFACTVTIYVPLLRAGPLNTSSWKFATFLTDVVAKDVTGESVLTVIADNIPIIILLVFFIFGSLNSLLW